MRLQHMLDLTFSQPQISNTVEYYQGEGLQFRIATEMEQVLKVKLTFVLESNVKQASEKYLNIKINSDYCPTV